MSADSATKPALKQETLNVSFDDTTTCQCRKLII